ncbi:MAG: hypothetical protein WA959_09040 [Rivularia sp. (in: cyanobacteria)]
MHCQDILYKITPLFEDLFFVLNENSRIPLLLISLWRSRFINPTITAGTHKNKAKYEFGFEIKTMTLSVLLNPGMG